MASVLSPGPLPLAQLHAARLDGELFTVDERFSPVDEVETAWLRARALRSVAGSRMIAELDSAMWVHGLLALPPVDPHHVRLSVRPRQIPAVSAVRAP